MFTDPPIHKIDQPAVHSKVAKHQLAVPQAVNSTKAKQLDPYQESKLIWNLRHYKLLVHCLHCSHRLGICQKNYTTKFSDERILHTENSLIETFFARDKQRKCIIISNLALFWLKLNSYYESLHLGVCKLAKYVRNCVVFWKNLHS